MTRDCHVRFLGGWGAAKAPRLPDRFRAGEVDRPELRRRLIPLQARLGRLLRRGQANPDRKAAGLCRELTKWWAALWTFARVDGVEPTNNGARLAPGGAVAQGQLRLGQRGGESVCRAAADSGSLVPPAGAAAVGVPGGRSRGGAAGESIAVSTPSTAGRLNAYRPATERRLRWQLTTRAFPSS